jgi:hypothetical protein
MRSLELGGETAQALERGSVIVERPHLTRGCPTFCV